jgi:hypothetical protein
LNEALSHTASVLQIPFCFEDLSDVKWLNWLADQMEGAV